MASFEAGRPGGPMSQREGEMSLSITKRDRPHQVAQPADQVRQNFTTSEAIALRPLCAARQQHLRHDDPDFVVYCLATATVAAEFWEQSEGEAIMPEASRRE